MQPLFAITVLLSLPGALLGQDLDTAKIDNVFGRPGQKSGETYKVSFPRSALHVILQGVTIKPGLALGSWAAFTGSDDNASVMGDLVLLPGKATYLQTSALALY